MVELAGIKATLLGVVAKDAEVRDCGHGAKAKATRLKVSG